MLLPFQLLFVAASFVVFVFADLVAASVAVSLAAALVVDLSFA